MGYLFEGMEKIDVQAERRRTKLVMKWAAFMEKRFEEGRLQIKEGRRQLEEGRLQVEEGRRQLEEGRRQLEEGRQQLEEKRRQVEEKKRIAKKEQQMERTIHIIRLNYQGKSDEEIAGQLNCSLEEVKEALIKIDM
ncbi:MAG: hypothetical protein ACI4AQ_07430 [Lachnospiraceae bacterium]